MHFLVNIKSSLDFLEMNEKERKEMKVKKLLERKNKKTFKKCLVERK